MGIKLYFSHWVLIAIEIIFILFYCLEVYLLS